MALSRAWQGAFLRPTLGIASRTPVRSLHVTRIQRASSSASGSQGDDDEHYPTEGFTAPIWRNTVLLLVAFAGIYRVSNLYADPAHPASDDDEEGDEDNRPFLTRYIDYYSTPASFWKARNERHLDLVREKAEEKLLFQDAERPAVHRLRYTSTFEQASPHRVGVGMQVDMSDLKVKKEDE